jgi:hypothetical protein
VLKVSVYWSPLPSKVSISWAFGQVPVVCALAGLGSLNTSHDKNKARLHDATIADTPSEATILCTADSSPMFDRRHSTGAGCSLTTFYRTGTSPSPVPVLPCAYSRGFGNPGQAT